MADFKWLLMPSADFGAVWVPVIGIQLRTATGRFKPAAACIDSGAVVSLLRRSWADELGLDLKSGRQVRLRNVGGAHVAGYVHQLVVRFEENEETADVPFAIAEQDSVPNLIGRAGILDRYRIKFDPVEHLTRIERANA